MKKIFLNSFVTLSLVTTFIGCAHKNSDVTATDTVGCRMMELEGGTRIITYSIGALIQKSGEAFKDEKEQREITEVCREVKYGNITRINEKKSGNLSSEENVSDYENKLNNCIKSHNINDFDANIGEQWNREDIKEQLKDCHVRIKNGENEFEQKSTQNENVEKLIN